MPLKIGELASLAGCLPVTIRFYEKKGLLKKPERTSANYRLYDDEDIERLRFILHCRQNGIGLDDIGALLAIRANGGACKAVHGLIDGYIDKVTREIASLEKLRSELKKLRDAGQQEHANGCSILDTLANADNCCFCSRLKSQASKSREALARPKRSS